MGSGKKIVKTVAKFDLGHQFGKSLGLPDPSGDLLYGSNKALTPAEKAEKAAKEQADATLEGANVQAQAQRDATAAIQKSSADAAQNAQNMANLDAQRVAQNAALDAARSQAEAAAQDGKVVTDTTPDVDLSLGSSANETESARRKRYNQGSSSLGGAVGSGVRL